MPFQRPSSKFDGEEALFSRLYSGELSAEERQAMEARLREDDAFRSAYLRWAHFDADLRTLLSSGELAAEKTALAPSSRQTRLAVVVPATVAAVLIVASLAWWSGWGGQQDRVLSSDTTKPEASGKTFEPDQPNDNLGGFIAVVVRAEGLADRDAGFAEAGRRLNSGRLTLQSGNLLICFLGGASLYLEGPAELVLQSPSSATLLHGRAAVRDSDNAKPFRLNVPQVAMVDLGTEFAVRTDDIGNSVVRVHEGSISVSTLDEKGHSKLNDVLRADEVASLTPGDAKPIQLRPDDSSFARVPGIPQASLKISPDYVASVLKSRPAVYWRFEEVDDEGLIPDRGSLGCRGRLVNRGEPEALTVADGVLNLAASTRPRRVESERPLPGISGGEYSVELWARTSRVDWQTIFGMIFGKPDAAPNAVAQIEYANDTFLVHGPMAIRSLCRPEGGQGGGNNIFGEDMWTPGVWNHIVVVRSNQSQQLFVDGRLIGVSAISPAVDQSPCTLTLGQLRDIQLRPGGRRPRQFLGSIDEFAYYDHALADDEILGHWNLSGVGGGSKSPVR